MSQIRNKIAFTLATIFIVAAFFYPGYTEVNGVVPPTSVVVSAVCVVLGIISLIWGLEGE